MSFRGRPVLGFVAGLFFGLFLALVFVTFSIRPPDNVTVLGLPAAGIVLGLLLAWFAPFGRRPEETYDEYADEGEYTDGDEA